MELDHRFYRFYVKRFLDVVISIIGILLCVLLIWWWVIIINTFVTKGKPFFLQKRLGYKEQIFTIFKFRTMKNNAIIIPPSDVQNESIYKITRFGRFLRKTSIDETPQLINVFLGQMSIIGPRPGLSVGEEKLRDLRKKYCPTAFEAKPGISGYSQTHLKRAHNPETKAIHDSWYVRHLNFVIDFKIFCLSILVLFGINCGK